MSSTAGLECKVAEKTPARGQSTGHRCRGGSGGPLRVVCVACKAQERFGDALMYRVLSIYCVPLLRS